MSRPNILNTSDIHKETCFGVIPGDFVWVGDVKRCRHGKYFVGYAVMGLASAQWQQLSPILNPIKYRRAKRVMRDA